MPAEAGYYLKKLLQYRLQLSIRHKPDILSEPAEVLKDITFGSSLSALLERDSMSVTASCHLPWACPAKSEFDVSPWYDQVFYVPKESETHLQLQAYGLRIFLLQLIYCLNLKLI